MAMTTASPTAYLPHNVEHSSFFPAKSRFRQFFPAKRASRFLAMAPKTKVLCVCLGRKSNRLSQLSEEAWMARPMAQYVAEASENKERNLNTSAKVNKYDDGWKKEWFGAGIFYEGSEDVEVDVFKTIEKRKVLSNVEKSGLLSKAEELGFTLSSIEKLGVFSKAEELGLLSLLEKAASFSPSALASASLPILVAAILAIVLIPDDSAGLVAVQVVVGGALAVGAVGLFVGSVVLGGLQEAD
ncbi:hypothetical protein TEA_019302 [Camellia sinensis var. sinensis]|uniref:DUF1118 domain-containing protein n=1 Tax=Camellia sinensis var. sinensis TaxID=542762 RepID=A0A4S4EDU1_CAMSN|nr:hypothetical protein TEA_019302 [Camellia sinensis var. sinensis]